MKRLLGVLAVCLILGFAGHAFAGTAAGDNTVIGSVAWTNLGVEDEDVNIWDVSGQIAVGRFVTDQLQLEVAASGLWMGSDIEGVSEDEYMFGIMLRPNFHFGTQSATVPYIGAAVGGYFWNYEGEEDTVFSYGAQIGLKQFIKENAFLQIEGSWQRFELEDLDAAIDAFRVWLGFGLKF